MKIVTRIGAVGLGLALAVGVAAPPAGAAETGAERRGTAHRVTLQATKSEIVTNAKVVLSGKVKPAARGTKVVIQKKVGDAKWRAETTVKTSKSGAFRYADRPRTAGIRLYRAVAPKSGKVKAGKSKPVEVTVLAWHNLTELSPRRSEAVVSGSTAAIKGTSYPSSVVSERDASSGAADWNLPDTCTTLRVRLGAGDDSDEGAVAHLSLTGDGQALATGSFGLTQSAQRTIDVSDVFRLAFTWSSTVGTSTEPAAGAQAVLGTPQLLCAY